MTDRLTPDEIEAIALVVARPARGRGSWFDAEATAHRFAEVARKNADLLSQVQDAAAKVRAKSSRNVE